MKRKLLFIFFVLAFASNVGAQGIFEKIYPVNLSNSFYTNIRLLLMPDSGYVFSSKVWNNPDIIIIIGRLDKFGNVIWVKQINDSTQAYESDITISPDGFLYATYSASTNNFSEYYSVILKLDIAGNILWSKSYGEPNKREYSKQISVTSTSIFISGDVDTSALGLSDIFILKTDTSGNLIWGKTFDAGGSEHLRKSKQFNNNEIFLSGNSETGFGINNFYLLKTDTNGTLLWNRRFHIPSYNEFNGQAITKDLNGNIILTGRVDSVNGIGSFNTWDIFLMKLSADGTFQWANIYGGADYDEGYSVFQTNDGGFMIGAEPESYGAVSRIALLKTDSIGNVEWIKLYGDTSGFLDDMVMNDDNGYTILASNGSYDDYAPMLLIKVDSIGTAFCGDSLVTIPHSTFTPLIDSITNIGVSSGGIPFTPLISNFPLTVSDFCGQGNSILNLYGFLNFEVSPNPFTSSITISIKKTNFKHFTLAIHNILGQTVYRMSENNFGNTYSKTIDMNKLSRGIYLLEVIIDGERTVKKIVKE
jgi:hypothetical protein